MICCDNYGCVMASEDFTKTIVDLISKKHEGPYWDFKRQWYDNEHKKNLLHDIICMANNIVNRDAYIIIGVDESNDYAPYDIRDDSYRRNTQQLTDFLGGKAFAGESRPMVTVNHVEACGYSVDVITVHNSDLTPFYLVEEEAGVHPNNIYIRVQNTNTPINKSADLTYVELLWRKRFGILYSPLERIHRYLKNPADWASSPQSEALSYYIYAPEFTIGYRFDYSGERTAKEYFHFYQTDSHPRWGDIFIKYHQTVMAEFTGLLLDGGRLVTSCPIMGGISLNGRFSWDLKYRYYIKDSLTYVVSRFYLDNNNNEQCFAYSNLLNAILLFESEEERIAFHSYVQRNWNTFECSENDLKLPWSLKKSGTDETIIQYRQEAIRVQKLREMLISFRDQLFAEKRG